MNSWTAGLFALLGVIITFTGNYFLNNAKFERERKVQNDKMVHDKLEEICQVAEDIRDSFKSIFGQALIAFGELQSKGKRDLVSLIPKDMKPFQWSKIRMLIDFYAPSLMPLYKRLEDARDVYGTVIVEIGKMTTMDKEKVKNQQSNLLAASEMMDKIINAITESTAKIARDIRA